MARTASIGIRVEPGLKACVEAAARADGRTVAQWIERLMVRELKPGELKNEQPSPTPDDTMRKIAEQQSAAARGRKSAERAMKRVGVKPDPA